jgi:hypothetical protein
MKNYLTLCFILFGLLACNICQANVLTPPAVECGALSHTFTPANPDLGWVAEEWVLGAPGTSITENLNDYYGVDLLFTAGTGNKFVVDLPAGTTSAFLTADISFASPGGDSSVWPDFKEVELIGKTGAPVFKDYSYVYVGGSGNVIKATVTFLIKGDVEFSGIRWSSLYYGGISVPDLSKTYTLTENSTKIRFSYATDLTSDPGTFVSIAPKTIGTFSTPVVECDSLLHTFTPSHSNGGPVIPGILRQEWRPSEFLPSFTENLTDYNEVEIRITPGENKKYVVDFPDGITEGFVSIDLIFRVPVGGDSSVWPDSSSVALEGLVGPAFIEDYFYAYVGGNGNVIKTQATLRFTGDVEFTGIKITGTYSGGISVPDVVKEYRLSGSDACYLRFYYSTYATSNPGIFTTIEDVLPGDLNGDNTTNMSDFSIFADSWLQ